MWEDVLFGIDPRRDLDQLHAFGGPLEHAAFGHIVDRLPGLGRVGAAEGDLLDLLDELLATCPSLTMLQLAVLDLDLRARRP